MTSGRYTRRRLLTAAGALSLSTVAGCLSESDDESASPTETSADGIPYDTSVDHEIEQWDQYNTDWTAPETAPQQGAYGIEVLAENLEIPWDIAFAPSGEVFLTERTGRILTVEQGEYETVTEPGAVIDAEALPPGSEEDSWYVEGGEGGLLGIAVHPNYPDVPLVYTYFTTETGDGRTNRVVAFDTTADDPADGSWVIVDDIPADAYHNGGRITFGPANYLWIAAGDGDPELDNPDAIADPGTLAGKILRVEPDGSAPAENPDIEGGDPRVYTYGHRNPQGLAWLPDGTPIITEHGPSGGDEVNVLRPGENYGWPEARNSDGFDSYAGTDYQPPVANAPSWAPSGCVFYTGEAVPSLQGRLLVGGLISQQVVAVTVTQDGSRLSADHESRHDADWMDSEYHAASTPLLPDELGRVRHVEQGPDGELYAVTSNRDGRAGDGFPTRHDDKLVRLTSN
ncbi:Glucose/arabinose dehydrogenase, beta-propeller fold [Halovenus aranensis]|uniref:Glucose/arabinose dehydrogenase, beta-propeller fold n=1 Tax=Halovenus aranensis TaxID=890420 RepID=A0A1G8WMD8_9EURY|nr:PQQ-dependent sugar dehydrogenase [Halovenus aranensis]SDJ79539.1 Glucose/arabinose dehydrogenase, beta-propeller fold [Halovenus aranensis]